MYQRWKYLPDRSRKTSDCEVMKITRERGRSQNASDKRRLSSERSSWMSGLQDRCNWTGRTLKTRWTWSQGTLKLITPNTRREHRLPGLYLLLAWGWNNQTHPLAVLNKWRLTTRIDFIEETCIKTDNIWGLLQFWNGCSGKAWILKGTQRERTS